MRTLWKFESTISRHSLENKMKTPETLNEKNVF